MALDKANPQAIEGLANYLDESSQINEPLPYGFTLERKPKEGSQEFYLNMGPQHPSTHGVLRLVLRLDGETVLEAVPHLGYIHRGIEKMGENQTCLQYIHLTDRLDYLSSHMNNLCVCLTIEKAMNIGVPERGEYIRVMVSELQRIQSHLLWWGAMGMDLGAITAFLYGFKEREKITALFEELCGARLTMNYFRPGGSNADLPTGFMPRVKEIVESMKGTLAEMDRFLTHNPVFRIRTQGVGVLSKAGALGHGCSGPVARASGVDFDVRKHQPYSIYERFDFKVAVATAGDCQARYQVRIREMEESLRILEQAIREIPEGDFRSKEKPGYKLPAGNFYSAVETARGLFGIYLVSENSFKPYRIKNRSPNFSNLSAVNEILAGCKIADIVTVLGTMDLILPDIDR